MPSSNRSLSKLGDPITVGVVLVHLGLVILVLLWRSPSSDSSASVVSAQLLNSSISASSSRTEPEPLAAAPGTPAAPAPKSPPSPALATSAPSAPLPATTTAAMAAPTATPSTASFAASTSPQTTPAQPSPSASSAAAQPTPTTPASISSASRVESSCALPRYPAASERMREEGLVTLRFLISENGQVLSGQVEKSSGYKRLDEAALAALSLCKFKPATRNGAPIQDWSTLRYRWELKDD